MLTVIQNTTILWDERSRKNCSFGKKYRLCLLLPWSWKQHVHSKHLYLSKKHQDDAGYSMFQTSDMYLPNYMASRSLNMGMHVRQKSRTTEVWRDIFLKMKATGPPKRRWFFTKMHGVVFQNWISPWQVH